MVLHYLYLASMLLSAVLAFIYRKNLKSRLLTIFIPFLFLVFTQELSLFIYVSKWPKASTGIVYNFYNPATAIFFSVLYYRIPFNAPVRKLILWLISVFIAIVIFTYIFIQPVTIYNSYLALAAGVVITCCGIFFLFNYFNLDNRTEEKHWLPVLWITVGLVAFYPVVNISYAFYKQLLAYRADIFGVKLYKVIPQLMSLFMYGCFSYAFFLCKKKN